MAVENLGASFTIDVTKLKAGLAQANRLIRESESEFRAAAAGMDNWEKSEKGLAAQIKNLNNVTEIQQKKVDALKSKYDLLISDGIDPASKQAVELRTNINKETEALNKNKKKLADAEIALNDMAHASEDAADNVEDVGEAAENVGDGFTIAKGAVAGFIANGLTALVGACKNAISSLLGLAESTREYREDMAKLDTAFSTAGHSTESAKKAYEDFYAILGESDRSVEAVNHLAELTKNEQELAKWSDIAAGVTAKFGDSLPIEGLTEAANETAKVGKVTGPLADALNWAGIAEDKFNEELEACTSEQQRATLITETLNKVYKEAADEYNELTASTQEARKATAKFEDAQARLGKKMEPISTAIRNGFAEIFEAIVDVTDSTDLEGFANDISKAFSKFIKTILPEIVKGFKWIIENGGTILSVLKSIGLGFAAFKITNIITSAVTAISGFVKALKAAAAGQHALNAAMAANVIGVAVTGVMLLIEGLKSLAKYDSEVVNGWNKINEAVEANTTTNLEWQSTMDSVKAELADYSKMTNAAGDSVSSLESKMEEAQNNITEIYATAYNENRGLRSDEIESIRQFNNDYMEAQRELSELQGLILKAQADSLKWQLDNMRDLSEEDQQAILNTMQEKRAEYIAYMGNSIAEEVALLDMRYQNGQISETEYATMRESALAKQQEYTNKSKELTNEVVQSALEAMRKQIEIDSEDFSNREHYFNSIEEIREHYNQRIKELDEDETKSGWTKFWEKQAITRAMRKEMDDFTAGMEVSWSDYNFMTNAKISQNTQAFFNWLGETKSTGNEITKENQDLAADILNAYSNLPEELEDSGIEALKGLLQGIDDDGTYSQLISSASSTADQLINAINDELGVQSPSWKMIESGKNVIRGLRDGTNDKLTVSSLLSVARSVAGSVLSAISAVFQEHSPSKATKKSGKNVVLGLASGISENKNIAVGAAENLGQMVALGIGNGFGNNISGVENDVYEALGTLQGVSRTNKNNSADGTASGKNGTESIIVNQTNYFSQAHSRIEIYKAKQQTAAAVRLATGGALIGR